MKVVQREATVVRLPHETIRCSSSRTRSLLEKGVQGFTSQLMSTVLEIEKAIEGLSTEELRKLFAWMEEKQAMISATASVFALYDDEEGDSQQWQE